MPIRAKTCTIQYQVISRRLKLWTRSSMTEERLSGLAMLLIHRDTELIPSPEEIFKPIGDKLNKTKLSIFILDCPSREHDMHVRVQWPSVSLHVHMYV